MTEKERLDYVNNRSGKDLLNELMDLIAKAREFDVVILIGSDTRLKLIESILDAQVIPIEIGTSPIVEDKWVDPEHLKKSYARLNLLGKELCADGGGTD